MTGSYYEDDHVVIYHGDCSEIIPKLSDVDMYFTSPPYNLGTSNGGIHDKSLAARKLSNGYGLYKDDMPQDEYTKWQCQIVEKMWGTLSDSGAIFYNHKPRSINGTMVLPTIYGENLPLRQVIIWNRETGLNFSPTFFLPKSEWVVLWAMPKWKLVNRSASQIGDIWTIPPENKQEHPAPFPIQLPKKAISATTAETIVDPFMGSGTTLRAAKDLGRKAIGIEIDEKYCEIAAKRMGQEVLPL